MKGWTATMEKNYTLRTLNAGDIFPMMRILSKVGIKEISKCFENEEVRKAIASATKGGETDTTAVGMSVVAKMAGLLLEHLPDCQEDIFKFLASVSSMTAKEIEALSMADFAEMIFDVIYKDEFSDFFTAVVKSIKRKS